MNGSYLNTVFQLGPNEDIENGRYGYPELRWQQTANYGYVPNPLLRKSFMAVAIDLPATNSTVDRYVPVYYDFGVLTCIIDFAKSATPRGAYHYI